MKSIFFSLVLACSTVAQVPKAEAPKSPAGKPREKDITSAIVNVVWKWNHPTARGRTLKLRPDGTCQTTKWAGVWKLTGPRQVEITTPENQKMKIEFDEKLMTFSGIHTDGQAVDGKRQGEVPASIR